MTILDPVPVARTGDDSPAGGLWTYVWRMSGWRQLALAALALAVSALALAPIELQRRLIDDAIATGDANLLWRLAAAYAAVALAHQGLKFAFRLAQSWLGESAVAYTRGHLLRLYASGHAGGEDAPGEAVAIIVSEAEKLGGFVGDGPSDAVADVALLIGVLAYMFWVQPGAALVGLALVAPQVLLAPVMQRRLNRLNAAHLRLARAFGDGVSRARRRAAPDRRDMIGRLYRNRMAIAAWKQAMKAALNLLGAAAPLALLLVGGLMVIAGSSSLGVIVAFLSALNRIAEPLRNLIGFYRRAAQARVQHDLIARWM